MRSQHSSTTGQTSIAGPPSTAGQASANGYPSMTATTNGGVLELSNSPASVESTEEIDDDGDTTSDGKGSSQIGVEMSGLQSKLRELERKKEELASCQLEVDGDIQAVKRTMELVATA